MKSSIIKHLSAFLIFAVICTVAIIILSGQVDITENNAEEITPIDTEENSDNNTDDTTTASDNEEPETDIKENVDETEHNFILKQSLDGEIKYLEKIVFLGDLNTYNMGRYTYTGIPDPMRQVWSVEQNVCATMITTVNNFIYPVTQETTNYLTAIKDRTPAFLVLSFGSYDNDEELTKNTMLSALGNFIVNIKATSPNTQLMIQSILPVAENCTVLTPAEVSERNEWLKELCKEFKIYYIDAYSELSDENGILLDNYSAGDGYFLNEEGYRQLVYYIRTHVHPNYSTLN